MTIVKLFQAACSNPIFNWNNHCLLRTQLNFTLTWCHCEKILSNAVIILVMHCNIELNFVKLSWHFTAETTAMCYSGLTHCVRVALIASHVRDFNKLFNIIVRSDFQLSGKKMKSKSECVFRRAEFICIFPFIPYNITRSLKMLSPWKHTHSHTQSLRGKCEAESQRHSSPCRFPVLLSRCSEVAAWRKGDYPCLWLVNTRMLREGEGKVLVVVVGGYGAGSLKEEEEDKEDVLLVHNWRQQGVKQHLYEARGSNCTEWRRARAAPSLSSGYPMPHHHCRSKTAY